MPQRLFLLTKSKPLTIFRHTAGTYVDGYWITTSPSEIIVTANIQPIKFWDIQSLPESDRTSKWAVVFTGVTEPLRTKKEGENGYEADKFFWQGDLYEIRRVQTNDMGILDHTESWAVRVELTPNPKEIVP